MIDKIRKEINGHLATWLAIASILISGTIGFIGIWMNVNSLNEQRFQDHEKTSNRLSILENTVSRNNARIDKAEIAENKLNLLIGQIDQLIKEHQHLEIIVNQHLQEDNAIHHKLGIDK